MIQKPLLWEKFLVCLWGFANCASLRLLDMTRNAPYYWTFSLGAWSASYELVGLREIPYGMLNRLRPIIELSSSTSSRQYHGVQNLVFGFSLSTLA
jgi:hypothetical protein